MTVQTAAIVVCDGDGCENVSSEESFPQETGQSQRRRLRSEGWRTNLPGGRDLCPECFTPKRRRRRAG